LCFGKNLTLKTMAPRKPAARQRKRAPGSLPPTTGA
jgi:hypothetical protein